MNGKVNAFAFHAFAVWIVLSSLYFLNFLLAGDVTAARNEVFVQQMGKHVVCLCFSAFLC